MKFRNEKIERFIELPYDLCICCGRNEYLFSKTFRWEKGSSLSDLSRLTFTGVDVMLNYWMARFYSIESKFSKNCWKEFSNMETSAQKAHLTFVLIIFVIIVICGASYSTVGSFGLSIVVLVGVSSAVGLRIWFDRFQYRYTPKIHRIRRTHLILKIKGKREIRHEFF